MHITTDGQIFERNECIGFIDDDAVYLFVRPTGHAVKIGDIDHRSEVAQLIKEWRLCSQS